MTGGSRDLHRETENEQVRVEIVNQAFGQIAAYQNDSLGRVNTLRKSHYPRKIEAVAQGAEVAHIAVQALANGPGEA